MIDGFAAISLLKEVISVGVDLLGETFSLLLVSQVSSWLICSCNLTAAVSYLGCCDMTLRLSPYDMRPILSLRELGCCACNG